MMNFELEKLEGAQIYLKPIAKEYAEAYLQWVTDSEVNRFTTVGAVDLEGEKAWIQEMVASQEDEVFNVFVKQGDKLIGNTGVHNLKDPDKRFLLGILIGEKDYWGKGYGTDAFQTVIKYAFEKKGAKKLFLEVAVENEPALQVYKKCGFKIIRKYKQLFQGVEREAFEMELTP